ncbi:aminoacyl-tRNA hydrolase [Thiorhodospira sibirica]|uniref:aminoacyl-tRNA hydrolase n=1 Tax=Thiorhodospira sibirica TaxID=154347 RepID=UPI00022C5286|nr:aminoacyl-tRNA hydrolase [Thiorhodospira sibirica]
MASADPILLIAGLGNPGNQYHDTRHNAGFWLVDQLAHQHGGMFRPEHKFAGEACRINIAGQPCWLLKPQTFMNRSGQSLKLLASFYRIPTEAILVVHDELDLPPGTVRLKRGGGHGGHNGLRDISHHLGQHFARLRIGIGHPGERAKVVSYVLERPSHVEAKAIDEAIAHTLPLIPQMITGQFDKAMNTLHARPASSA